MLRMFNGAAPFLFKFKILIKISVVMREAALSDGYFFRC